MIVFSFRIPEGSRFDRGPVVLVLVLEKENFDRMRAADPLDILFAKLSGLTTLDSQLGEVDLILAYEEDLTAITRFQAQKDWAGLMTYLERGRKVIPGDAEPPVVLRKI